MPGLTAVALACLAAVALGMPEAPRQVASDFATPGLLPWEPQAGQWAVRDGALQQAAAAGTASIALPYAYENLAISLKFKLADGTPPAGKIGIRLFADDAAQTADGYLLTVAGDGTIEAFQHGLRLVRTGPLPNPADWHHVTFQVDGDTMLAQFDALPPWLGTDRAGERRGRVELLTVGAAAQFDDVVVTRMGVPPTYTPPPGGATPAPLPLHDRAFYCPAATTGAGASLMQFWTAGELEERIDSFLDLPALLERARALGTATLYLVDWWDGHYMNKGDYDISQALGGEAAFQAGIDAVHAAGGRVVLYVEPYIIAKDTRIGREHGEAWAMMNADGTYKDYYGRDNYYVMYPGEGSGWTDYLAALCGRLAERYAIDGVHLDSFGTQWGHADYHPGRPQARNGEGFNRGAVRLVKEVRKALRDHEPHAVVWLEGAENEPLLDACDGAQIESLAVLRRKPWHHLDRYNVYVADFDLRTMQAILDEGYHLALCDYWFRGVPSERTLARLREGIEHGRARAAHHDFWQMVNIATANGIAVPPGIADPAEIHAKMEDAQWSVPRDGERHALPELVNAVDAYAPLIAPLRDATPALPAEAIKRWLAAAPVR